MPLRIEEIMVVKNMEDSDVFADAVEWSSKVNVEHL